MASPATLAVAIDRLPLVRMLASPPVVVRLARSGCSARRSDLRPEALTSQLRSSRLTTISPLALARPVVPLLRICHASRWPPTPIYCPLWRRPDQIGRRSGDDPDIAACVAAAGHGTAGDCHIAACVQRIDPATRRRRSAARSVRLPSAILPPARSGPLGNQPAVCRQIAEGAHVM